MTDLVDFQHEVQGVLFGAGTAYPLGDWTGPGGADQNYGDVDAPQADGQWQGQDWLSTRTFTFTDLKAIAPGSPSIALQLHAALKAAWVFPGRTTPLATCSYRYKLPGEETKVVFGRPRRFTPSFANLAIGMVVTQATFDAGDPLIYADVEDTVSLGMGSSGDSGLILPVTLPLTIEGLGSDSSSAYLTNRGNATSWATVRFTGPITGPKLLNLTSGEYLELPSLVLTSGQYVDIDCRPVARTVLRNGTASVFSRLSSGSTFFGLLPGSNELRFSAATYSSVASAIVTARSAWEM